MLRGNIVPDGALTTNGRFSGGSSGISVGHISPEAAAGGVIGLIEDDDTIVVDVASRTLEVQVTDEVLPSAAPKWRPANARGTRGTATAR